jgi:hypothetical protein
LKECPQRKPGRKKKTVQRGGAGGGGVGNGRNHPHPQIVQNVGAMRNLNPTYNPVRGYIPPSRFHHNSIYGAQTNQGRFQNPGEFSPHRWGPNPIPGNFKLQNNSSMRYGMPQAGPPPFKPQVPLMDMNKRIGVPGHPPFARIQGNMRPAIGHEQMNVTGMQLRGETYAEMRQECYEMVHRLGLIQNRNMSTGLNHLKPKGEIHCVPKVPSDVVVVDVFPPGRR